SRRWLGRRRPTWRLISFRFRRRRRKLNGVLASYPLIPTVIASFSIFKKKKKSSDRNVPGMEFLARVISWDNKRLGGSDRTAIAGPGHNREISAWQWPEKDIILCESGYVRVVFFPRS